MWGFGYRVESLVFVFRVSRSGFRVSGFGFGFFEFRDSGFGIRVSGREPL